MIANKFLVVDRLKTIKIIMRISYLFIFLAFKLPSLFLQILSGLSFALFAFIVDISLIIYLSLQEQIA